MKLTIFVHELFLEVGHSNATIEVVKNLPCEIEQLDVVCYTHGELNSLFPNIKKFKIHKCYFPLKKPFLLKAMIFHIYCAYIHLFIPKDSIRISVGTASLWADIVNIQFVFHQWAKHFFKERMSLLNFVYKKLLFKYFLWNERYLYNNKKTMFLMLSKFINDYCKQEFSIDDHRSKIIYSGVNIDRFVLSSLSRTDLYQTLLKDYPTLSNIDPAKPIALFVGAYERKGLATVLKTLAKAEGSQLIVIGSGSVDSNINFNQPNIKVAKIKFTKELDLFYSLCDSFLFPTIYEPFGLVIMEAAAIGLEVYVTRNEVGATEILEGLPGIHVFDTQSEFKVGNLKILSTEEKLSNRNLRMETIRKYSWDKAGKMFYQLLSNKQNL